MATQGIFVYARLILSHCSHADLGVQSKREDTVLLLCVQYKRMKTQCLYSACGPKGDRFTGLL